MIARSALAPVFLSPAPSPQCASRCIHPQIPAELRPCASSFWYCFKIAFFGSFRIFTSISCASPCRVKITGRRPINSGIIPNAADILQGDFLQKIAGSSSYLSLRSAWNPIDACFVQPFLDDVFQTWERASADKQECSWYSPSAIRHHGIFAVGAPTPALPLHCPLRVLTFPAEPIPR